MEVINLGNKNGESLLVNYYKSDSKSNEALVFVGGYGDDRNTFGGFALNLLDKLKLDVITVSFRGIETNNLSTLNQQVEDLKQIVEFSLNKKQKSELILVCTSDGAYSVSSVLAEDNISQAVSRVIFLDPANYYIHQGEDSPWEFVWPGFVEYEPSDTTSSDLLKNLNSKTIVDVVHFSIRNYSPNGYSPNNKAEDNPKMFPRLNVDMVKSFFENTPVKNRGKYIEDKTFPHAFMRDGNIKKNVNKITSLIIKLIK